MSTFSLVSSSLASIISWIPCYAIQHIYLLVRTDLSLPPRARVVVIGHDDAHGRLPVHDVLRGREHDRVGHDFGPGGFNMIQ